MIRERKFFATPIVDALQSESIPVDRTTRGIASLLSRHTRNTSQHQQRSAKKPKASSGTFRQSGYRNGTEDYPVR
jgi:hypothetical protein